MRFQANSTIKVLVISGIRPAARLPIFRLPLFAETVETHLQVETYKEKRRKGGSDEYSQVQKGCYGGDYRLDAGGVAGCAGAGTGPDIQHRRNNRRGERPVWGCGRRSNSQSC